ncbi:MAG: rod shape-determining protein MreC [Aliifodinibius sp.]|nr:rod shape-determining protein MreC [Fodinibius sp.]
MNFRNNRQWQSIAIGLIIVGILALALGGFLSPLGNAVAYPILSVQQWMTTRFQAFQDFFNAPTDLVRLRQRNAELEAEVANLQTEVIALQQQVTEVELLSALLDFARSQRENEYISASVVFRDPRPFLKYVVIDVGTDDGILSGMPVVSAAGLVGRIDAVTANASRVQLITDPASSVNVNIQPSDTTAVLSGSITGDISLDLIPQDAEVEPGDLILTSGIGGNFPSNILVGQVASVRGEATALFQQAAVQPAVDFSRLNIVLVIVDYRSIDIAPLIPEEIEE